MKKFKQFIVTVYPDKKDPLWPTTLEFDIAAFTATEAKQAGMSLAPRYGMAKPRKATAINTSALFVKSTITIEYQP